MVGPGKIYCMYLSFAGTIFFVFIAFCCFVGMEALKLPKGESAKIGLEVLLSAIVKI